MIMGTVADRPDPETSGPDSGNAVEVFGFVSGGTRWRVWLDRAGKFRAAAPGSKDVYGETFEQVQNNAKVQMTQARVRVEVPYAYLDKTRSYGRRLEWKTGTATGIHSGNQNVLAVQGGKQRQISSFEYGNSYLIRPPSPEDAGIILRLEEEIHARKTALNGLYAQYKFPGGLHGAVMAAVAVKTQETMAKEDDGDGHA